SSRHAPNHVVLIAIVDAHVGIRWPDKYRVNAAVPLLKIVEVAVNGVLAGNGIVEEAILHHHLWLYETGLSPLQLWHLVARRVVADANAAFVAPMGHIRKPLLMLLRRTFRRAPFPSTTHFKTLRSWDLLPISVPCSSSARDIGSVLPNQGDCTHHRKG